jgi:hypothetical protein
MEFIYKGENVVVEILHGEVVWVYAYNMRMKMSVVPYDLKTEIEYLLSKI